MGQFKRTAGWLPQTIPVPVWHLPPKLAQNTTSQCSLWRVCRKSRAGSQEAVTRPPPRTCLRGPEPFRPLYLTCGQVWLRGAGDTSRGQHVPKAIGSSACQGPRWLLPHSRPVKSRSAVLRGCTGPASLGTLFSLFPLHMEPCCPGDSSATSLTACFPGQGSELPTSRNTRVRDDSLGFKREKIL